jgi:hypothetical protein
LNPKKRKLSTLSSELESIYARAKVCRNESGECLELEPGLTDLMQNSRDYDELVWAWKGWHDASGKKMRSIFAETVKIQNKAARDNNYTDLSEYWIDDFEDDEFEKNAADLFERIKPLYQQVHMYVGKKLQNLYGNKYPTWHDPQLIPAHLLGLGNVDLKILMRISNYKRDFYLLLRKYVGAGLGWHIRYCETFSKR